MKKLALIALTVAFVAAGAYAQTNEYTNTYVQAEYGVADINGFDRAFLGKATIGKEINSWLNIEFHAKYTGLDATQTYTDTDTVVTTTPGTPGTPGTPDDPGNVKPGNGGGHGYGWYRRHGPYRPPTPGTPCTPGTPGSTTTNTITRVIESGDAVNYVTLTGNIVVDYKNDTVLTPYGLVGWGFSIADGELFGHQSSFAWQAGVGLQIDVSENVALDGGVLYVEDWDREELELFGVNYTFGIKAAF